MSVLEAIFIPMLGISISSLIYVLLKYRRENHDPTFVSNTYLERSFKLLLKLNMFNIIMGTIVIFLYFCTKK